MSDRTTVLKEFSAQATTFIGEAISMEGRRNPIFSQEITAVSAGAGNHVVEIQTTNVDSTLHAIAAYWERIHVFAAINNAVVPPTYISESTLNNGESISGAIRTIPGRFIRIVSTLTGTFNFTGKVRMAYDVAVTE